MAPRRRRRGGREGPGGLLPGPRSWLLGLAAAATLARWALAALGAGLALLLDPAEWAPPGDSARRALWLFVREELPSLLDVAALACYLSALLGLPGRPPGPASPAPPCWCWPGRRRSSSP